jgi:hypothetical protein
MDLANAVVGTNAFCDRASGLTKVLIPNLPKKLLVLLNQLADLIQLTTRKAIVGGKLYWMQSELRFIFGRFDVYVSRFLAFVTEEIEAISAYPQHGWHRRVYRIWWKSNRIYSTRKG